MFVCEYCNCKLEIDLLGVVGICYHYVQLLSTRISNRESNPATEIAKRFGICCSNRFVETSSCKRNRQTTLFTHIYTANMK